MTRNVFNAPVGQVTNVDGPARVGLASDFDGMFGSAGKDRTVSVRLPEQYVDRIKKMAAFENKGQSEYIRAALLFYNHFSPDSDRAYNPERDVRVLMMTDTSVHQRLMDIYRL